MQREEDPVDLDRLGLRPVTAIGIRGETMYPVRAEHAFPPTKDV